MHGRRAWMASHAIIEISSSTCTAGDGCWRVCARVWAVGCRGCTPQWRRWGRRLTTCPADWNDAPFKVSLLSYFKHDGSGKRRVGAWERAEGETQNPRYSPSGPCSRFDSMCVCPSVCMFTCVSVCLSAYPRPEPRLIRVRLGVKRSPSLI